MKKIFITLILFALGVGAIGLAATSASAQNASSDYPTIVEVFAERFGLNQQEVQDVFDEHKQVRYEEMEERKESQLNDLVEEGTLTSQQRDALLAKYQEMKASREDWRSLDPDQRHEMIQDHHDEMEAWADEQGIDLEEIMPMKKGFHKGSKSGFHMGR